MATKKTTRRSTARKTTTGAAATETGATAKKKTAKTRKKKASAGKAASASAAPQAHPVRLPEGPVRVEREIGGRTLTLETGRMAKLADGAVVARYGDTVVLATAQSAQARDDIDFFPLTVDYREKAAAAGKFPGGFFKREGRPTTREILTCRIIDRSIRPLFADGFRRETQVLTQVLATDKENDSDILAAIASFAALAISSIPNGKTLGACRIGLREDKLVVNPTWSALQAEDNELNLTVAAHRDAIVMVEAGAKQVPESVVLEALELGHQVCAEVADLIDELVALAGKPALDWEPPVQDEKLAASIEKQFGDVLAAAAVVPGNKADRYAAIKSAKAEVAEAFAVPAGADDKAAAQHKKRVGEICSALVKRGERESILRGQRADGRDSETIRPLSIDVSVLPSVHGSSLFTRGETQSLCIATLGTADDQQFLDGIYPEPKRSWLLHYAFPPFSVGEVRRFLAPGRREIGHGALAERAIEAVLPSKTDFPYSLRVTSEILESNGSSSMATVCGATLALMDAGVPIQQPVAGIAMGLVVEDGQIAILSDILGSEDACGDMDFKVAGTGRGITALQMDIKCEGLARETMERALEQARQGRLYILREMLKVIRQPRASVSPNAPKLASITISPDKIGVIIGPQGRNIRKLQEEFETRINIDDSGVAEVSGFEAAKVDACLERMQQMVADVELGAVYKGKVVGIKEFGCFVEILPGQEGMVHVSELSNEFIRSVTDVVQMGDEIEVKVIDIDDFGKVKLSRRALLEPAAGDRAPRPERGDRERRGPRERPAGRTRDDDRPSRRRPERDDDDRGARRRDDRWDEPRGRDRDRRPARAVRDEPAPELDAAPRADSEPDDEPRRVPSRRRERSPWGDEPRDRGDRGERGDRDRDRGERGDRERGDRGGRGDRGRGRGPRGRDRDEGPRDDWDRDRDWSRDRVRDDERDGRRGGRPPRADRERERPRADDDRERAPRGPRRERDDWVEERGRGDRERRPGGRDRGGRDRPRAGDDVELDSRPAPAESAAGFGADVVASIDDDSFPGGDERRPRRRRRR